jgi:adenine phosphoribosyltransferase
MKIDESFLRSKIRDVPDFPTKGVVFKDITPLLQDYSAVRYAVERIAEHFKDKCIDAVVSAESRCFIFGAILSYAMKTSFVPLRKPGKLPWKTLRKEFETEYSKDAFEIHVDSLKKGERVLIVDDVLATGGTASAAVELAKMLGAEVVGLAFLIELDFLKGREKLAGYEVFSLLHYK